MFIRKAAFEYLLERCENQQIDKLSEAIDILPVSVGRQLEFDFGKDWNLSISETVGEHRITVGRQDVYPDWSF